MRRCKAYYQGRKAYKDGTPWTANPYSVGGKDWDEWNQGKGDAGEKDERKLFKAFPQLLKGS